MCKLQLTYFVESQDILNTEIMFEKLGRPSGIQLNALMSSINKCFEEEWLFYDDHFSRDLQVVNIFYLKLKIYQNYFATVEINQILALYSSEK